MSQVAKYENRYGDVYTFTKQEDGSVLWEGDFKHCRFGWPNVYKKAYQQYRKDGGDMHINTFKREVHEMEYNENDEYVGPGPICAKYGHLVTSDTNTIDMIDPSGGPYLKAGQMLSHIIWFDEFNVIIESFERVETGYIIKCKEHKVDPNDFSHLADTKIIGGIINTTE